MIRVLEDRVVNQIAAGEVVERPASVVKELVENSLDAGARVLRVELRAGGRSLVRVVDDGCGMDRQDAMMCLERHATSKIRSEQDLVDIVTLGFRGEAVPSIAAVSRFELLTRPAEQMVGTKVTVEGGRLAGAVDAGCPAGTQITVRSLFYNVPARRKFLRTIPTELAHCVEAVTREVLMRPRLDVEVVHEGRTLLRAPPTDSLAARATDVLKDKGEGLHPVAFKVGALEVSGLVSPPGVHRASAQGATYLYVNDRYVQDPLLRRAVREAYRGLVPRGRHPVVVLDVRLPGDHVDVNVHPAKTEVRFQHGRDLQREVARGLREALDAGGLVFALANPKRAPLPPPDPRQAALLGGKGPAEPEDPSTASPVPAAYQEQDPRPAPTWPSSHLAEPVASPPDPMPRSARPPLPPTPGATAAPMGPAKALAAGRLVGEVAGRWLLLDGVGEVLVVDLCQARAEVFAARLRAGRDAGAPATQRLMMPALVELDPSAEAAVDRLADALGALGLDVGSFGGGTVVVKAMPPDLAGVALDPLLLDIAACPSPDELVGLLAAAGAAVPRPAGAPFEQRALVDELSAAGDAAAGRACRRMGVDAFAAAVGPS